ncbi:uncharacterized protein V1518DRAFT_404014 [Limtongia smithiae]|uniref:uncharacterized protein n=1 Tax=Limtongia smithiae TaxID=1125753 RepID=UPI0034CF47F9
MSSPAVTEFESVLQSMLELRAPGVSGSKIRRLSEIAMQNIQSESVLFQKLYTHFKRAPNTHKLGALYVIDAVVRAYQDEARKLGQVPSADSPEGTPAAAVFRVSGLIDNLMADIVSAPEDQKDKILKVVDIWERATTFSPELIASMRGHFKNDSGSTTPPYPPPSHLLPQAPRESSPFKSTPAPGPAIHAPASPALAAPSAFPPAPASAPAVPTAPAPVTDTTSILEALAIMAKQKDTPSATSATSLAVPSPKPERSAVPISAPPPPPPPPASAQGSLLSMMSQNGGAPSYSSPSSGQFNSLASALGQGAVLPQAPAGGLEFTSLLSGAASAPPAPAPALANGGIDFSSLLPLMSNGQQPFQSQPQTTPAIPAGLAGFPGYMSAAAPAQNGMEQQLALMQLLISQGVPINQILPLLQNAAPFGATPPSMSAPSWATQSQDDSRGRGSGAFGSGSRRSRSPDGRRSGSPSYRNRSPRGGENRRPAPDIRAKTITMDTTMPPDCIKVMSRTLFVGGVPQTMSEAELIAVFEQCRPVQSVIMNKDKRCAFLKVYRREDAEAIKDTMETYHGDDFTLRCRWGVGFGPRDCCEYSAGISTIPIARLTDADKRWVTTAEYGGTGGRKLMPGMVVEEPDIEIGAGVSSKAISRRMPTNSSGEMGPKSTTPDSFRGRRRRR